MVKFYGYAFGMAGTDNSTAIAPNLLKESKLLKNLKFDYSWQQIITPNQSSDKIHNLNDYCEKFIEQLTKNTNKFCVFGGDHTSAIATLQAAQILYHDLKVIYVDAHMDLHNLSTSHSQNMHGMSLSVLFGQADAELRQLKKFPNDLNPKNVCLFGIRSYESEEQELLNKLGINVVYMSEIAQNGLANSWQRALEKIALKPTDKLVISVDIDAFDPKYAPAVTVPEPNGLNPDEFIKALNDSKQTWQPATVGCEVVEFSPKNDINQKTENVIANILDCLFT